MEKLVTTKQHTNTIMVGPFELLRPINHPGFSELVIAPVLMSKMVCGTPSPKDRHTPFT